MIPKMIAKNVLKLIPKMVPKMVPKYPHKWKAQGHLSTNQVGGGEAPPTPWFGDKWHELFICGHIWGPFLVPFLVSFLAPFFLSFSVPFLVLILLVVQGGFYYIRFLLYTFFIIYDFYYMRKCRKITDSPGVSVILRVWMMPQDQFFEPDLILRVPAPENLQNQPKIE